MFGISEPHDQKWVLLRSTYGSQMADIPGFRFVGFAGAPLPRFTGPRVLHRETRGNTGARAQELPRLRVLRLQLPNAHVRTRHSNPTVRPRRGGRMRCR